MADKHDVFVGNLTFNTTEEQLREKFSFVGPVKNIRILADKESGKPKGFAFVEYFDPNTALAAIRHLDQTELNSRKLKVGYPAQSNLKDLARQIGQVVPESSADGSGGGGGGGGMGSSSAATRQQIEQTVINSLKLHEAWDLLDAMKKLVAEDNNRGNKAKAILETHPQLISAMYEIHKRLGIALPKNVQQQQQQGSTTAADTSSSKDTRTADQIANAAPIVDQRDYSSRWDPREQYRNNNSSNDWDSRVDNRDRDRDGWEREWEQPALSNMPPSSIGNMRASGGRAHTYHDHPYGGNGNSGGGGGAPVGGGAGMYEHQQQQRFQQPPPLAPQFRAPPRQQQPQQYPQDNYGGGGMDAGGGGGYPPIDGAQFSYDYPLPDSSVHSVPMMPQPERKSRFK